jgi:hypothetical protein
MEDKNTNGMSGVEPAASRKISNDAYKNNKEATDATYTETNIPGADDKDPRDLGNLQRQLKSRCALYQSSTYHYLLLSYGTLTAGILP